MVDLTDIILESVQNKNPEMGKSAKRKYIQCRNIEFIAMYVNDR